jgi:hypothetical protein
MRKRVLALLLPLLIGLMTSCGDDDGGNDGGVPQACSPPYPDIGCFKGAVCASERVGAVCVNSRWMCPAGTTGTESCLELPSHDGGPLDGGTKDIPSADLPAAGDVGADGQDDGPRACSPPYPDIGCFKGEICRSEHVSAVCVNGGWTCPAGTGATEFCPPEPPASDAAPPDDP